MEFRTATELAALLRARAISASELLTQTIDDIESGDGAINAIVVRDFERAREQARIADRALQRGETLPLLGVPMTVKEAFRVTGLPCTWGLPGTIEIPVAEDAAVVARLKNAGAIIVGKTNIATMLADWQCENPVYGVTNNPWDLARTPGGSSGGGAAALAAGLVPLEFGSDLSSSLRVPAHFCGIYAHKPSFGIVPTRGFAPPGAPAGVPPLDLAVVGPMARSASDLALALDVAAGADGLDATAWRLALPASRHASLKDYRVLMLDAHPLIPTSSNIRGAIEERSNALAKMGCKVARATQVVPDLKDVAALFVELLMSLFSAESSDEDYARARAAADSLPGNVDSLVAAGVRGPALSHRDWIRADRRRHALAQQWSALFESWDVVLCPAMPIGAYPHRPHRSGCFDVDGIAMPYNLQTLWGTLATVTGNPATVAPLGAGPDGLPVGAQIIGPFLEDKTTIGFAALMEREFGGFVAPRAAR